MSESAREDAHNSVSVSGEGNIVAGGDLNYMMGVDPAIHAGFISENDRMKRALVRLGLDPDTDDFEAAIDRVLENATSEEDSGRSIDPEDSLNYGWAALRKTLPHQLAIQILHRPREQLRVWLEHTF